MKSQSVKKYITIINIAHNMFYLTCHLHGIEEQKTNANGFVSNFLDAILTRHFKINR
jgi:hypothetical protein